MGCFMGCFGLSSSKKRRNSTRKILPRHQRICSYELLHSSDPIDASTVADNPEKISCSNLRCEVETENEEKKGTKKTRKRVRFDLNVQTFEPALLPSRYENYCSDDDDEDGKGEELSNASSSVYPPNYRYHNCVDSFEEEEEDELGYGESGSDLEDEDYYTDDETDYEDDADDEDEEDGDKDVTPLLNPVENMQQWKAVKAKPVRVKELIMKENAGVVVTDDQAKPLLKEIIVNTSLSSWISPIVDITNIEKR